MSNSHFCSDQFPNSFKTARQCGIAVTSQVLTSVAVRTVTKLDVFKS